jgi:phosphopantothenoylcysteine decarboxylase/phosphopantothenate--cysteine ligase
MLGESARPRRVPAGAWGSVRVLVTAGGTREPIDAVRFVGNRSSGRMGYALAAAAHARGAEVTVVAANVALPCPTGVRCHEVSTAAELEQACEREFPACDVLLMAAAVADFRPVESSTSSGKLKKGARQRLSIELEPTTDVLSSLAARRRPGQTLVGFAAEHGARTLAEARKKLQRKGLDAVVANDVSRRGSGFESPENEVFVLTRAAELHLGHAPKSEIAEGILDAVEKLRAGAKARVGGNARETGGRRLRALPTRL